MKKLLACLLLTSCNLGVDGLGDYEWRAFVDCKGVDARTRLEINSDVEIAGWDCRVSPFRREADAEIVEVYCEQDGHAFDLLTACSTDEPSNTSRLQLYDETECSLVVACTDGAL